jgi:hypothetical protein
MLSATEVRKPRKAAPAVTIDRDLTCWRCDKRLAESVARPWHFVCPRCKATNRSEPAGRD